MNEQTLSGYEAAQAGAAAYVQPEAGYLRVAGPDQVAFLQRQTTNDVRLLSAERAVLTVLTSPTGRVLDVLYLLQEPDGSMGVLTLPGYGSATARFLKSRIFFMDKVTVEDRSADYLQLDLLGPGTAETLTGLGLPALPELDQPVALPFQGETVRVLASRGPFGLGNRLVAPVSMREAFLAALQTAGVELLSPETYETLRVEAGLPQSRHELTEDYTPLETGLEIAVSGTKGCYTGQEIIARQITYDKVTQGMVGLKLRAPGQPGEKLLAEGRSVGAVTSVANSPRFGPIGLAVVKRPHYAPGTQLGMGESGEAVVVKLPFGTP